MVDKIKIVFVEKRRPGLSSGRSGWIEGQLGQKAFARGNPSRYLLELLQVTHAYLSLAVQGFEARLIPAAYAGELGRPGGRVCVETGHEVTKGLPFRKVHSGWSELGQEAQVEPVRLEPVPDVAGYGRPDAGEELQGAEGGQRVVRVFRPTQNSENIFDVGGFQEA